MIEEIEIWMSGIMNLVVGEVLLLLVIWDVNCVFVWKVVVMVKFVMVVMCFVMVVNMVLVIGLIRVMVIVVL